MRKYDELLGSIKRVFNNNEIKSKVDNPNQWEYHFNPKKSKYHDYEESYFKQPSTGKILRLTARDALGLITFHDYGWDAQKLFDQMEWGSTNYEDKISVDDLQLFLDEYNQGNMNQVICFICDNEIEYNYSDKNDYLKL